MSGTEGDGCVAEQVANLWLPTVVQCSRAVTQGAGVAAVLINKDQEASNCNQVDRVYCM